MINKFNKLGISANSIARSINDVSELLYNDPSYRIILFKELLGVDVLYRNDVYGILMCKELVHYIISNNFNRLPTIEELDEKVKVRMEKGGWEYVCAGIDIVNDGEVTVRVDSKKERAKVLYNNLVLCDNPLNNKDFCKVLMVELGLTDSGARTYSYNIRTGKY